jgi:DNA primase
LSVYQKDSGWAYRCFSCNDHGDVLNALMKVKNISFKEAMTQCGSDSSHLPPATLKKIPREIKAGGRWQVAV